MCRRYTAGTKPPQLRPTQVYYCEVCAQYCADRNAIQFQPSAPNGSAIDRVSSAAVFIVAAAIALVTFTFIVLLGIRWRAATTVTAVAACLRWRQFSTLNSAQTHARGAAPNGILGSTITTSTSGPDDSEHGRHGARAYTVATQV